MFITAGHDVDVPGHLLPAFTLFHPYTGEAEVLGLTGIRHLSAPHNCLAARRDGRVAIEPQVLDLSLVESNYQEARSHHPKNLLLAYELI